MNILLVSGMYPPMRTGTAFYTQNLALALQSRGHRITVITLQTDDGDDDERLDVRRLPAIRLPMKNFFKHFRICSLYPSNWARVARIAEETESDALLLVNHYLDIAFPAILAARRRRVPLLCSVGTQLQSMNPGRNRILNFLDRLICGRMVFPFCNRIVAWDTQIRKYLADVQGDEILGKTVVVNYGVNGDPVHLLEHNSDYAQRHTILGVGAVSEQRSFVPLVKAFAVLAPAFPQLRLRIVGHVYYDGAQRMAAELGVADRIEFLGEQTHDTVLAEMRNADLFYSSLTGQYVGLGTATIEAMLLGVPTVVNTPLDLLGTGVMEDGVHILQAPELDPAGIAEKIRRLLTDAGLRRAVGQGGRRFVEKYLNWSVVAYDMEAVVSAAIAEVTGKK